MPQLPAAIAGQVNDAENPFGLMEPHVARAILTKVEVGEGAKGPYWKWLFKTTGDSQYPNRNITHITSLSAAAAYGLKETFDAFGVPTTTDTDELIGETVRLKISQRTISKGPRAGELDNNVRGVLVDVDGAGEGSSELPF